MIQEKVKIKVLPEFIDEQCIPLFYALNSLPGLRTFESCCGHGKAPFSMWFRCDNIDTLSRLGRAVGKNYSDNNWEIVVDTADIEPRGCFWLRTKTVLESDELNDSIAKLVENIEYWFDNKFDEHFKED